MNLARIITREVRLPVTDRRDEVFNFRKNKDLYTNLKRNKVINPQVDHIVEDQKVGRPAAKVLVNINYNASRKIRK